MKPSIKKHNGVQYEIIKSGEDKLLCKFTFPDGRIVYKDLEILIDDAIQRRESVTKLIQSLDEQTTSDNNKKGFIVKAKNVTKKAIRIILVDAIIDKVKDWLF